MREFRFYIPISTPVTDCAVKLLQQAGCTINRKAQPDITHVLLSVPTFAPDGTLRGGGAPDTVLECIPSTAVIIGGNLSSDKVGSRPVCDLLQDPVYTAMNADITAHCAIKITLNHLQVTLRGCRILIIGWGRIGKCLAQLLRSIGAEVTVAARKAQDRAALLSLGYHAIHPDDIQAIQYDVIYNTAPAMVLPDCDGNALKIELASVPGIGGNDVISASGLPGKEAPESSGKLIAETVLRILSERR